MKGSMFILCLVLLLVSLVTACDPSYETIKGTVTAISGKYVELESGAIYEKASMCFAKISVGKTYYLSITSGKITDAKQVPEK